MFAGRTLDRKILIPLDIRLLSTGEGGAAIWGVV